MTNTKNLVWRLKEQPTTSSLQLLVNSGILTKEEAREILFSLETQETRDMESLKSEIKFLRDLVEKLAKRTTVVEKIREIEKPYWKYCWYEPYKLWCKNEADLYCYTGTDTVNLNTNSSTSAVKSFSDIKTFN